MHCCYVSIKIWDANAPEYNTHICNILYWNYVHQLEWTMNASPIQFVMGAINSIVYILRRKHQQQTLCRQAATRSKSLTVMIVASNCSGKFKISIWSVCCLEWCSVFLFYTHKSKDECIANLRLKLPSFQPKVDKFDHTAYKFCTIEMVENPRWKPRNK